MQEEALVFLISFNFFTVYMYFKCGQGVLKVINMTKDNFSTGINKLERFIKVVNITKPLYPG